MLAHDQQVWPERIRACRVCGCTDDDYTDCVDVLGEPCCWVDVDLCSRCGCPCCGDPACTCELLDDPLGCDNPSCDCTDVEPPPRPVTTIHAVGGLL